MRICVVGGIFNPIHAGSQRYTPETILVEGLRTRGVSVEAVSHLAFRPSDSYDLVHVHHVGRAAHLLACTPTNSAFVFTGHDGQMLCGYDRNPLRKAAFSRIVRRCDAAIALSETEARYLKSLGQTWIDIVPNGIPDPWGTSTHAPSEGNRSGLLYVGQLIPLKGVATLIRSLALTKRAIRLQLVYHVAKDEPKLRALCRELRISDRVDFLGPRRPDQVAALMASAEALVLPSFAESLPSVVTEALLSGTPVIASAVGGIPEQVGRHGRVLPAGCAEDFAAAIDALGFAPASLADRSAMRAHAAGAYSVAAMIEGHVRVYSEILQRRPSSSRGHSLLDPAFRFAVACYWRTNPTVRLPRGTNDGAR